MSPRVRLLLVDDSEIFTAMMRTAAARVPSVEIVGVAHNGLEGVAMVKALRPDVVSMDVYMPVLGGVDAVARIMDEAATPIAMVTGAESSEIAGISFRAVGAGALDVLAKPSGPADAAAILERLTLLAGVRVQRRAPRSSARPDLPTPFPGAPPTSPGATPTDVASLQVAPGRVQCVGIAISTGGPPVLEAALRELPRDYPVPLLIVQHLSQGFDAHLATWLGQAAAVQVAVATDGARAAPGTAYLAPYDRHLRVRPGGLLAVDGASERVDGHRPSGTVLLRSIASTYGTHGAGVVLTGMGSDGAAGLLDLRAAGGVTAAQDAATSAVDGMPRVARERGAAAHVVRGADLGLLLRRLVGR